MKAQKSWKSLCGILVVSLFVGLLSPLFAVPAYAMPSTPILTPVTVQIWPESLTASADTGTMELKIVATTKSGPLANESVVVKGAQLKEFSGTLNATGGLEASLSVTTTVAGKYSGQISIGSEGTVTRTVNSGDSLWKYCMEYGNDWNSFLKANESLKKLVPGEIVTLNVLPQVKLFTYEIVPGSPAQAEVNVTNLAAGQSPKFYGKVMDKNGNPVAGTVPLTVTTAPGDIAATANPKFVATSEPHMVVGKYSYSIKAGTTELAKGEFQVVPGPAASLDLSVGDYTWEAGSEFRFFGYLRDEFGNIIPTSSNLWYRVDQAGREPIILSESGVTLTIPASTQTITTTKASTVYIGMCLMGKCASTSVKISPAPLAEIKITAPEQVGLNNDFNVKVIGLDQFGNKTSGKFDLTAKGAHVDVTMNDVEFGKNIMLPADTVTGTITVEVKTGIVSAKAEVNVVEKTAAASAAPTTAPSAPVSTSPSASLMDSYKVPAGKPWYWTPSTGTVHENETNYAVRPALGFSQLWVVYGQLSPVFTLKQGEQVFVYEETEDGRWAKVHNGAGTLAMMRTMDLTYRQPPAKNSYTLQSGDSFWSLWLTNGNGVDWNTWLNSVLALNGLTLEQASNLMAGTVISLP